MRETDSRAVAERLCARCGVALGNAGGEPDGERCGSCVRAAAVEPFGVRVVPIPARLARSPWGAVDEVREHGAGVWFVTTPGHGGFMVDADAWRRMPRGLRMIGTPFGEFYAFEEDCCYAAVVAAFPLMFAPASVDVARRMVRDWYPRHAEGQEGCGTPQLGASFHRCVR